ncbi:MAG TPA: hypothetical protein ENK28_02655 [Aliiroseovarius sp.]|nr:hypothetical protein [Aliiroseovarius sp.]
MSQAADTLAPTRDSLFWRAFRRGLIVYLGRSARKVLLTRAFSGGNDTPRRFLPNDVRDIMRRVEQDAATLRPIAQLDRLTRSGNRILVELAILTIAAYRVLCILGIKKAEARAAVADIGWDIYAAQLRLASLPFRLTSRDPAVRLQRSLNMLLRFPFSAPGAPGYEVRSWSENGSTFTHFTHCPPQSFVRDLIAHQGDQGELAAFYASWCQYDWPGADIIAGDGQRWHYQRRKTLSAGDSVCDMCWKGQIDRRVSTPSLSREEQGALPPAKGTPHKTAKARTLYERGRE